ncbi:hypothetical protein GCM10025773_12110 [Microbacterium jejuense]
MSFPAKFEGGLCPADCGQRIHAGDEVTYDTADRLVHASCTPRPDPFTIGAHETVCPDCFCVRPCRCVDD